MPVATEDRCYFTTVLGLDREAREIQCRLAHPHEGEPHRAWNRSFVVEWDDNERRRVFRKV